MSKRDPLARPTPRLLPGHGNSHAAGSRGGSSGGFGGKGRASEATIDHQKERLMAKLHWMLKQDERRAAEPPAADASATPALPFATLPSSDYALVSAYLQQQLSDQALLPPPTRLLQRECRARGTLLRVMPAGMMRHADNTSTVHAKSKAIHWRVEWYFDALSLKHVDAKLHENLPWSVAFGSLLGLAANHEWTALPPVNAAAADLPAADKASVAAAAFDHLLPPTRRSTAVGSASIGAFGALQHQLGLLRGQSSLSDLALLIAAPEQPVCRVLDISEIS